MKIIYCAGILFLLLVCHPVQAQTIVSSDELLFDVHNVYEIGKELVIRRDEAHPLPAGDYLCNYKIGSEVFPISFTIDSAGHPDGTVACDGHFRTSVRHGFIYRYAYFNPGTAHAAEECYMSGDTVIEVDYNRLGQQKARYVKLNGERIYSYSCTCDAVTDSIAECSLIDLLRGIYIEYYAGGRVRSKRIAKGLPDNVQETDELFDRKGRRTEQQISYTDGSTKTIYSDGRYKTVSPLKSNPYARKVREYDKTGKLRNSYEYNDAPPTNIDVMPQ